MLLDTTKTWSGILITNIVNFLFSSYKLVKQWIIIISFILILTYSCKNNSKINILQEVCICIGHFVVNKMYFFLFVCEYYLHCDTLKKYITSVDKITLRYIRLHLHNYPTNFVIIVYTTFIKLSLIAFRKIDIGVLSYTAISFKKKKEFQQQ